MPPVTPDPLIAQARKDWKKAADAAKAQREAILACKKFRALDQWPEALKLAREGAASIQGQPPQPGRPCLVVDRLSQPVRIESNKIKNADFGFDVLPNGSGADIETAQIIKGYLRRVQNQSRGESPVEWAADGAIEGGLGWFRIKTRFVHEQWDGDPTDPEAYDQELVLERIPNTLAVYDDPSANRPTRSDALFRFIVEDMDRDAFMARFPSAELRGLDDFESLGDMKAWVSKDIIRVAEYWRVTFENREIWASKDMKTGGEGKPPKGVDVLYHRTIRKPVVKGSLINAVQELEKFDWVGSRIPTVPVLGEELNVDGKAVLRGIISMGMDAQRMVNYTYSSGIEIFALEPRKAPTVPWKSIAQYKAIWDTRNVYNYAYWPYDQYDTQGRQYNPPTFDNSQAPIEAAIGLMRTSEEAIKASTSTGDASLGNTNPNERSGKALEALQSQAELANSNYPDNVRRALIYAAELMGEVIPKITRPGQIWHIMGMDDQPEQVIVGKPFTKGPDGMPVAAPDNVTPEMAKAKDSLYKFYDPTAGKYAFTVTVGKASATRQQEGAKALGDLIPHLPPEMAAVVMPDYVKQLSFPGAQGIAERLESTLPPHLQPKKDGEQSPVPPEVQAQMQQMQAALQEAQMAVQTDQAKQQASIETARLKEEGEMRREEMRIAADLEKARMDNAARIEVARIGAEKTMAGIQVQAEEERRATGIQIDEAAAQREHEAGMAAMAAAGEAAESEADRAAAREARDAEQTFGAEQADADRKAAREQSERAAQVKAASAAKKDA